jgi:diguanylate cyclase (GGDEF)-like protein/PAS domain S-box-containing protein
MRLVRFYALQLNLKEWSTIMANTTHTMGITRTDEHLQRADLQIEQLIVHSPAVVYRLKVDGERIIPITASSNISQLLGFAVAETLSYEWWDGQLHPEDRDLAIVSIAELLKQDSSRTEYRIRHKDGSYRWIDDSRRLYRDESGQPSEIIGIWVDITERKQSEDEARRSAAMLRTIIDNIPAQVFWKDKNLRYLGCNKLFAQTAGEDDPTALIGKSDHDLVWQKNAEDYRRDDRQVIQSKLPKLNYEEPQTKADGSISWLSTSKVPLVDADSRAIGVLGILSDITERKKAEEKVRQLSRAVEQSPTSIMVTDWNGNIEYVNPKFTEISGYSLNEVFGKNPRLLKSGETPAGVYKDLWSTIVSGKEWHGELANRKKNGKLFWEHASISPVIDERGKATHFVAVKEDITERKQAEKALQLAALVYQHSAEAMLVTNAENRIIAINPAFTELTGYHVEEVLGKNPRLLSSGRQSPAFYAEMWQSIATTGSWKGELWNHRKNGDLFAEWASINTFFNRDGSVGGYVALISDITQKKKSEETIWHQANFDSLTELPNRSMFQDRLSQEILKVRRNGMRLALLFIDLDQFKDINDTLGHESGDLLLIEAARRISGCVRESDTVARLGGDEFTVILSGLDDFNVVDLIAEKINTALASPFCLGNEKCFISGSIGIARYPMDADEVGGLLKHADMAMYVAKKSGRNRYSYYDHELEPIAQTRLRLIGDLRNALDEKQLRVFYQPIVELASGRIFKAEALLRWEHPKLGWISPAEFIPLAEESGIINSIGDWIFKEAAREVKRLRELHHPDFQISVNKSPSQFRNDLKYYKTWLEHLCELGLPGQSMIVEITEGLLMNVGPVVTEKLKVFCESGIQLALDDFGTGYSSLAYLKKFDIDFLKIDQSFVKNLGANSDSLALCEAMILMAHKLGIKVIAEGVETELQRKLLADIGCDFAQGYLFSRPVPANAFETFLEHHTHTNVCFTTTTD